MSHQTGYHRVRRHDSDGPVTPRHPRGEAVTVDASATEDGIAVSFEVATSPGGPFVTLTGTEAENILRGTGTRFDLVDAAPASTPVNTPMADAFFGIFGMTRGVPPYTPTDPSPARVGRPED